MADLEQSSLLESNDLIFDASLASDIEGVLLESDDALYPAAIAGAERRLRGFSY